MEQDIDDLEELRKELGLYANKNKIRQGIALEHLLKAYKELEEENKTKLEVFELGKESSRKRIEYDYIPKSKIKEKISELDRKITYIESQYTNGGQNCNSNYLSAFYQKQILQELLEGEELGWKK